jgi:hypothetical protein
MRPRGGRRRRRRPLRRRSPAPGQSGLHAGESSLTEERAIPILRPDREAHVERIVLPACDTKRRRRSTMPQKSGSRSRPKTQYWIWEPTRTTARPPDAGRAKAASTAGSERPGWAEVCEHRANHRPRASPRTRRALPRRPRRRLYHAVHPPLAGGRADRLAMDAPLAGVADVLALLANVLHDPAQPSLAWPVAARHDLAPAPLFYALAIALLAPVVVPAARLAVVYLPSATSLLVGSQPAAGGLRHQHRAHDAERGARPRPLLRAVLRPLARA